MREIPDLLNKMVVPGYSLMEQSSFAINPRQVSELQKKLIDGHPLDYLRGWSEFYHHQFFINPNVLIPRPETEFLVDILVKKLQGKVNSVLDIGTGSGVILLSLLGHGVGTRGCGVDISPQALEVAEINAHRLRLSSQTTFQLGDRLHGISGKFDLIVSNPPYIKASLHRALVHPSVLNFEPYQALFLEDGEYEKWFDAFFKQIRQHLNGYFMMEGHELELKYQSQQLIDLGFDQVCVLQDLAGTDRFLWAQAPK